MYSWEWAGSRCVHLFLQQPWLADRRTAYLQKWILVFRRVNALQNGDFHGINATPCDWAFKVAGAGLPNFERTL